jgi:hypothetical protein
MNCGHRLGLLAALAAIFFVAPGVASAYQVTVHVHGAGAITESTARNLMNCNVPSDGRSEATVFDCTAGTTSGNYAFGDIIQLDASVPAAAFARGWRFSKWVDSSAGSQINCDPQDSTGDHLGTQCKFQIFDNLQTNLYFDDVEGPTGTTLNGGPLGPTNQTTANFTFNASGDPDATFECKLDRPGLTGVYVTCGGPLDKGENYSGLTTNGTYTLSFRSKDPSGNIGNPSYTRTWVVDTVAPGAIIGGGPAAGSTVASTSAAFNVSMTEAGSLSCSLDGVASGCPTGVRSYSSLGQGAHTFVLTATDQAGNVASASRTWTVDSVAPVAPAITSGPPAATTSRSAIVGFTGPGDAASFRCALDGGVATTCVSPVAYTSLPDGSHIVSVTALDEVGNESTAATRTWRVDTKAPSTRLVRSPARSTTSRTATFGFASSEKGSRFQCKLDRGAFTSCKSPKTYRKLKKGQHTFQVRAIDAVGNRDGTPARKTWRIK